MGVEWILASIVSWTGFRLDILFVRVVRAGAVFFGLAIAISLPAVKFGTTAPRLDQAPAVIDTVGYSVDETECADVPADYAFGLAA